jgi:TP901 family phage tail tape measure protein
LAGKAVESRWTLKDLFTPRVKEANDAVKQFKDALGTADVAGKAFAKVQSEDAVALLKQKAALKENQKAVRDLTGIAQMAIPFLGVGIGAALGSAVKSTMDFQNQMSQVGTLLNETGAQGKARLSELSDQIMSISQESGAPLSELTAGMYQVISAFGDTASAAEQLEIADKAAAAGNSTVADSVNLLSAVMKGYGDTSTIMEQKVSDLALQTVKLGKTTYPELAASMSGVTSSAKLMGVSVQELFATQATLAVSLGGASQVSTDMASALKALMAPSTQMKSALKNLGFSTGQALIKAKGFKGALQDLVQSTNGNTAALTKMFGRVEGMKLAIQLAGSASKDYDQNLKAMNNSAGATNQALSVATNTLQHKWKVAVQDVTTSVINMVMKFHLIDGISAILNVFSQHFKILIPVIVGVSIALGTYVTYTTVAKIATIAFGGALKMTPLGWVSMALGLVAIAVMWLANNFQTAKLWAMDAWNGIVKATQWAINMGISYINTYLQAYKFAFDAIKFAGISIWDGIVKAAQAGVNAVLHIISPLNGLLKHIGLSIPTAVNFSGAIVAAAAPKLDTNFGIQHVNLSGAQFSTSQLSAQATKAHAEQNKLTADHIQALKDNTKAVTANNNSTDANTNASNANTKASKANTKALSGSSSAAGSMSAEQIADSLMPRLERHLYGT